MIRRRDEAAYWHTVASRPWLRVITSTATPVPEGLHNLDPNLFVVLNIKTQQYEVHEVNPFPAISYVLAADELDGRIVDRARQARHDQDPFQAAEAWSREFREQADRDANRKVEAIARDLADAAAYDEGGRRSF